MAACDHPVPKFYCAPASYLFVCWFFTVCSGVRLHPSATLWLRESAVPFFAVAAADVLNLSIMRHNEIEQGVDIRTAVGCCDGACVFANTHLLTCISHL